MWERDEGRGEEGAWVLEVASAHESRRMRFSLATVHGHVRKHARTCASTGTSAHR